MIAGGDPLIPLEILILKHLLNLSDEELGFQLTGLYGRESRYCSDRNIIVAITITLITPGRR
jgi:hypothetical protein